MSKKTEDVKDDANVTSRRATLRKLGKYAAVSAPAVTVLLAASTRPARALPISEVPPPP